MNVLRLTPQNVHQKPTVVLLCGPHIQGAQGVSCGRHLANHGVEVVLFLPNFVKMQESVTSEVQLYGGTSSKQVASVKGSTQQRGGGAAGLVCDTDWKGRASNGIQSTDRRCPLVEHHWRVDDHS